MEENGRFHYYLADELGSPLRVSNWETPENRAADSQNYLTYGYDEFGNDPGKELEQAGIPNPYSRQGEDQSARTGGFGGINVGINSIIRIFTKRLQSRKHE